jgi:hypothetical protein
MDANRPDLMGDDDSGNSIMYYVPPPIHSSSGASHGVMNRN